MRILIIVCLGMLLAPVAQAQFIDCDGPGGPGTGCSEILYGLGNDNPLGPFTQSTIIGRNGPGDGSCGPELLFPVRGQIRLREQDSCVVAADTRCPVEIPLITDDSGYLNANKALFEIPGLGFVAGLAASLIDMGGNLGQRQLSGTCGVSGDECALDSECDAQNAGDVCRSTCFSEPGTLGPQLLNFTCF